MTLKDLLEVTFQKTKIQIIVTFPYGSDKSQYIVSKKPMFKDELLGYKKVEPYPLLDHEIHFIDTELAQDERTGMYFTQLDVFIWG